MFRRLLLWLLFLGVGHFLLSGSISDWRVIESEHFRLYYPKPYEYRAQLYLRVLEPQVAYVSALTGHPLPKTTLVLEDHGLFYNSLAYPERVLVQQWLWPSPSSGFMTQYHHWLQTVGVHELIHIGQMTHATGKSRWLTTPFGLGWSPNVFLPRWMLEGIAVVGESGISDYQGRLKVDYGEELICLQMDSDNPMSLAEITYPYYGFPYGSARYLYGGYFLTWIEDSYGEGVLQDFFKTQGGRPFEALWGTLLPGLGMDSAISHVLSKRKKGRYTFQSLYDDWQDSLQEMPALESQEVLTQSGDYKAFGKVVDGQYFYMTAVRSKPDAERWETDYVIRRFEPNNNSHDIVTFSAPIQTPFHVVGDYLYVGLNDAGFGFHNRGNSGFGSQLFLTQVSLKTGQKKTLYRGMATGFVPLSDEVFLVAEFDPSHWQSDLVTLDQGERTSHSTLALYVSELLVHDNRLFAIAKTEWSAWQLYEIDRETYEPTLLFSSPWAVTDVAGVSDGLLFAFNYEGKTRPYHYGFETGSLSRFDLNRYGRYPGVIGDDLYYIGLTAQGEELVVHSGDRVSFALPEVEVPDPVLSPSLEFQQRSLTSSLASSLFPINRGLPSLIRGQDHLDVFGYSVNYSSFSGFQGVVRSQLFQPVQMIGVFENSLRPQALVLMPFRYQLRQGLQRLTGYYRNFGSHHMLGGQMTFGTLDHEITFLGEARGGEVWGTFGRVDVVRDFEKGHVMASWWGGTDFPVITRLRGVGVTYEGLDSASFGSLEGTYQLRQQRQGAWDLNAFVGDLYGTLFAEVGTAQGRETVIGGELELEVHTSFYLDWRYVLGGSYALEAEEWGYYLGILLRY